MAPEGIFLKSSTHPRAYGNFSRLLGKYVREERVIKFEDAVYRLTGLPATNLGLDGRGFLQVGKFADVVIFDPQTIGDRATFEKPHQYAVGMKHVFVNGVQVLLDGEHTGAKPGARCGGRARSNRQSDLNGVRMMTECRQLYSRRLRYTTDNPKLTV
jgi:N-acyl-D-amino-acid deacylase